MMSVSVCLCMCAFLSVIIFSQLHVRSSPNFLCVLPMAVAWASCGGLMILYYQELATIGDAPVSVKLITS